MVANIKKKLSVWKGRFVSITSRVTLIKFVLFSMPLFLMFIFKMPHSVIKEITKMERQFLWGWGMKGKNDLD